MSDNKDSTAALWNSEVASVKHSPRDAIPEFNHRPEDGTKVPPSAGGENAWDIFPDEDAWAYRTNQPSEFKREVAATVSKSAAQSGDAKGLARGSSDEDVDW